MYNIDLNWFILFSKAFTYEFIIFSRAKEEALRIKKKIEADINELEIELDRANKANAETAKAIKRAAANLLEVDTAVCEEAKARADIQDQAGIAERKGISINISHEEIWRMIDIRNIQVIKLILQYI